jgi:hypothetical protein
MTPQRPIQRGRFPVTVEAVEPRVLMSATGAHHKKAAVHTPAPTPVATAASTATFTPVALAGYVGGTTATAAKKKKAAKKAKVTVSAGATLTPGVIVGGTTPNGKTPAQVRAAYGLGAAGSASISYPVTFGTVIGDGAGQTIAIIDAYDDPNAASDLHHFSAYFGLPDAPSFQVLNEYGQSTSLPSTDPAGADNQSGTWEEEESLDIEWAHVMAPKANLILYEANSAGGTDLYQTILTAADNPAVTVVSMSFGGGEYDGEAGDDFVFATPSSHSAGGVTFLASTGDGGAGTEAPSTSPDVVAVGGTSLYLNGNGSYASESAWSDGGGGVSTYEAQPTYQAGTVGAYSTTQRTVPDVAALADPYTGVPIYDSYDFGTNTPWLGGGYVEGGTSLACPLWAGVVAVADQGRATEGLPSLYSETGTLTRLYQLPETDFHDVTTGSDGNAAGPGYDLATGRGSPVANQLIPDLAGAATVTGRAFVDTNGDGTYDGTDTALAGKTAYLDLNNDGVLDNGEPSTVTSATGTYTFADEPAGGTVRMATPAGYTAVSTGTSSTITYGSTDTVNFAFFPTAYSTATAGAEYTLQTNANGTVDQVLLNGTLTDSIPKGSLTSLSFTLTGAGDGLTVNGANGNPLPSGGVTVTGTAGQGDALVVDGTGGNDAFTASASAVTFGSVPITFANLGNVSIDPGVGTDTLAVAGGSLTVTAPAAGAGILARRFSALSVASGATLAFATAPAHADRQVVVTSATPSVAGTLNLGGNDMIVGDGDVAGVTALAAAGYAGGAWNGTGGLSSSAAHNDASRLTALGVMSDAAAGGGAVYATFDGIAVTAADVLVKYTIYGDANLDGTVNAADYTRTDVGFIDPNLTGWANGDFNYDGSVDGSDYTLIDNAFNSQTTAM